MFGGVCVLVVEMAALVALTAWRAAAGGSAAPACAWALALWALLYVGPRLGYWTYRQAVETTRAPTEPNWSPLPSQARVLEDLERFVCAPSVRQSGVLVSLGGPAGSGKTTVALMLRGRLRHRAEQADRPVRPIFILFDAWQHQAATSMEGAIYRAIANNCDVLSSGGWFWRPFYVLAIWNLIQNTRLSIRLGQLDARVETDPHPPPVIWRQHLERLCRRLTERRRPCHIVLLLDEVDRCEARAAQVVLTLARRLLAVSGLAVVLPYVEEQLRFKVFNPLAAELPDIGSFMHAILWDEVWKDDHATGASFMRERIRALSETPVAGPRPPEGTGRCAADVGEALGRLLGGWHFARSKWERDISTRAFEDKYLSCISLHIKPLMAQDVMQIIREHARVKTALEAYNLDDAGLNEVVSLAGTIVDRGEAARAQRDELWTVRQVEGALTEMLSEYWALLSDRPAGVMPINVAKLAVLAALQYRPKEAVA